MLTKKEYNDIAEYVMKELMGNRPKIYTLEYWSKNGAINGNGILKHLRENYTIDMNEESENRYTVYRSEHGIAIVPNTSFESDLIERMNKGTHVEPLPEVAQYINNITETIVNCIEKDCYIPSEETDRERWERMNGYQRCCQAAADAARKEHELRTGNMTAETINIKRIEELEEIVSVLCCVVLEMGRPSYNNLQNDIERLKYVLAKKGNQDKDEK